MSWNFSASRDRFFCQSLNSGNPQGLHKIKITDAQFPAQGSSLLNTKLVLLLGLSVMLKLTTLLTFFFHIIYSCFLLWCFSAVHKQTSVPCLCVLSHVQLFPTVACQAPIRGIFQARILEWVAISFSRGSSLSGNGTWVCCTICEFFTIWATKEALCPLQSSIYFFLLLFQPSFQISFIQGAPQTCPGSLGLWSKWSLPLPWWNIPL